MDFSKSELNLLNVCKVIPFSILRFSKKKVPHVLCYKEKVQHSVAYFSKNDHYRVFFPYRSDNQEQVDCKTVEDLCEFFGVAMPQQERKYAHQVDPDRHHRRR